MLARNAWYATQERMDNTLAAQDNATLVWTLLNLYNYRQSDPAWLDKSATYLSEDYEQIDVPSGRTEYGSSSYKQFLLFFADAFPDSIVELTNVFATEDQAVAEFIGRGTNTGPLHMPTGDIPPTGRHSEVRYCGVFRIKSEKIVSFHMYYDTMTMLQNLGLVPAMG